MKLTYPIEPTETMQIITPLGKQHAIPIWRPIGERSKPVFWTQPEVVIDEEPPKPNVTLEYLCERIMVWMQEHGDAGFTHWEIADALNENRQTVGQNLLRNKHLFWRSSKKIVVAWVTNGGRERKWRLNLWHLRKESK